MRRYLAALVVVLILGASSHGQVATLPLLGQITGPSVMPVSVGTAVTSLGDVDGDGADDFAYTSKGTPGLVSNAMTVVSGKTLAPLYNFTGGGPGVFEVGLVLGELDDVDGDGLQEVAAMAYGAPYGGGITETKALIYSSYDGSLLFEALGGGGAGSPSYPNPSVSLSRIQTGDFNGDGLADIIEADPSFGLAAGRVSVHGGTTVFEPQAARGNVADPNGSGFRDVLQVEVAGSPSSSAGGLTRTRGFLVGTNLGIWIEGQPGNAAIQPAYAIFGKVIPGADHSTYTMPFGIGEMCFTPEIFDPLGTAPLFTLLNTFGGLTTVLPGSAPGNPGQLSLVANTGPIPFPVTFWIQGFLVDAAKPWPYLSLTNAIRVVVH